MKFHTFVVVDRLLVGCFEFEQMVLGVFGVCCYIFIIIYAPLVLFIIGRLVSFKFFFLSLLSFFLIL